MAFAWIWTKVEHWAPQNLKKNALKNFKKIVSGINIPFSNYGGEEDIGIWLKEGWIAFSDWDQGGETERVAVIRIH